MKNYLFLSLLIMLASYANAKIKLPHLVDNNMVLQQNTNVCLWGESDANSRITVSVSWSKQRFTTSADNNGKWKLSVVTPSASYDSHSITILENKTDKVVLNNILIGEVWLASGQSNMEMPLKGFGGCCTKDGVQDAIRASHESPYVRMYNVPKKQNYTLQDTCGGRWMTPTFANAMEFSATAYYFASSLSNALHIPVGIVNSSYGGAHVESWTSREVLSQYPDIPLDSVGVYNFGHSDYDRPLLMYNAMFNPIKNYTYKGIIWYQGCSNIGHADVYAQRLSNMVSLWRKEIALGEIPFYYVEIAPYMYSDGSRIDAALLREAQFKAQYLIPNSGVISTNDLVEPYEVYNIHPREKRKVGLRLSLLALNRTYGMNNICCTGPRYKENSLRIEGTSAVISFEDIQMGICRNYAIEGFEIAGGDKVFYPAKASYDWRKNEMYLTSDSVSAPVAVRYCFKDFQIGNLIGGNELPLFPFRTDNW